MTGKQLRRLRQRKLGLTQRQLAEQLGVRSNTVARWERGELRITEPTARLVRLIVAGPLDDAAVETFLRTLSDGDAATRTERIQAIFRRRLTELRALADLATRADDDGGT